MSIARSATVGSTAVFAAAITLRNGGNASAQVTLAEGNADCNAPQDAAWVSVPTPLLNVPPQGSQTAGIMLAAASLGLGTHAATLCVIGGTAEPIAVPLELDIHVPTPDPGNLLANGQFDVDLAGWSTGSGIDGGSTAWSGSEGAPESGSLQVVHPGGCKCLVYADSCVAVAPGGLYQLSYAIRNEGVAPPFASVVGAFVEWASDGACQTTFGDQVLDVPTGVPQGAWLMHTADLLATPVGAQSALVVLGVYDASSTPVSVLYDDVEFRVERVFASGFEGPEL